MLGWASCFDRILAHGDPAFIPFARTFRTGTSWATASSRPATWSSRPPPDLPRGVRRHVREGQDEIIVSTGGGRVGDHLLMTALEAAALWPEGPAWRCWSASICRTSGSKHWSSGREAGRRPDGPGGMWWSSAPGPTFRHCSDAPPVPQPGRLQHGDGGPGRGLPGCRRALCRRARNRAVAALPPAGRARPPPGGRRGGARSGDASGSGATGARGTQSVGAGRPRMDGAERTARLLIAALARLDARNHA